MLRWPMFLFFVEILASGTGLLGGPLRADKDPQLNVPRVGGWGGLLAS